MVQLRIYSDTEGSKARWNSDSEKTARSQDYWALEDATRCHERELQEGLEKRGITCSQTSHSLRNKPGQGSRRLAKLYSRSEQGLLLYEDIETSELRKFVTARGLELNIDHTRKNKKYLETLLEKADEEATFTYFERLPSELRIFVYEHYMRALDTMAAHLPLLPPLVKASRLLRAESLPVFYDLSTLYHLSRSPGFDQLRLAASQEDHIARFRHIQVNVIVQPESFGRYRSNFNISLTIDMPVNGGAPVFHVRFVEGDEITTMTPKSDWAEPRGVHVGELVQDFLLELKSRSDSVLTGDYGGKGSFRGLGLRSGDLRFLNKMLEHSHPQGW